MYINRKFQSWRSGLIYILIAIFIPIIPVFVYVFADKNDTFLFVLTIAAIVSLIYEFIRDDRNCSTMIKVENIVVCLVLAVMLTWALFLLFYINSVDGADIDSVKAQKSILLCLFVVPIIATLIEIARAILADLMSKKYAPASQNIVNGAKNV